MIRVVIRLKIRPCRKGLGKTMPVLCKYANLLKLN